LPDNFSFPRARLQEKFANMLERLSNVENSVHHHRAQLRDVLTAHAQVIDGHEQVSSI
jgi:hypothetical protein